MSRIGLGLIGICGCVTVLCSPGLSHGHERGIVGWGETVIVDQSALEGCSAVAAGGYHSLALKPDGTGRVLKGEKRAELPRVRAAVRRWS